MRHRQRLDTLYPSLDTDFQPRSLPHPFTAACLEVGLARGVTRRGLFSAQLRRLIHAQHVVSGSDTPRTPRTRTVSFLLSTIFALPLLFTLCPRTWSCAVRGAALASAQPLRKVRR